MTDPPRVLIEDWLPVQELGIESRREAAPIPGQFPKLKTLHVWWARRPLAASAGVVLGSLMPAWTPELAARFPDIPELKTETSYRRWFLNLCGIHGDPVAAKKASLEAKAAGKPLKDNPFNYRPAFKNSPSSADLRSLSTLLNATWGDAISVIDPTAGGGSIPAEASRYGLRTIANDLNPVAAAVLRAGVELPSHYGAGLGADLRRWGGQLIALLVDRLVSFFPALPGEQVLNYLFARTVTCPRTGKLVPLSPNWWLSREKGKEAAVRLVTERDGRELEQAEFEIVTGRGLRDLDPDRGTIAGGDATSPWDGLAISGEYIKGEAQAGRMGSQLYAVAVRIDGKRGFRAPDQTDLDALAAAEAELARRLPGWLSDGVVPSEEVPPGKKTAEPLSIGMTRWCDFFSPRQLLVHGSFVEEFRAIIPEVRAAFPDDIDRTNAVLALLGMMQGKALNWNSLLASWDASRQKMRSVFDQHNFSIKLGFAEFEGARELYPWCLDQLVDAYQGIAELLEPADSQQRATTSVDGDFRPGQVTVLHGTAADLRDVADGSQTLVCIDPPYYDNVMYAELADFFAVWEQHTVGAVWPGIYDGLCDKKNEAVANDARFADSGRRRKELANADYEAKMTAIFAECHRVLRDDGVMAVMFTHKRAEAWDTLGMGLMEAGFTIETSWPVNTESEQSLHQASKNAAASTIMLICRKRDADDGDHPFFEDLEGDVRAAARDALQRFSNDGITGVDLLLSTYGPALSVISSRWPVYSSEADPQGRSRLLRPEEALDAARMEMVRLQRLRLIGRPVQLDPITDFALIAWETFKAAEFPFDEARRLALAVGGLEVDDLARAKVLEKKSGTVVLLEPRRRIRRAADDDATLPGIRVDSTHFNTVLDMIHTVLYIADTDGLAAAKAYIDRNRLAEDPRFLGALQGFVTAIPRTRIKDKWVRAEAGLLDALCAAYFPTITMPEVAGPAEAVEQLTFLPEG